MHIKKLWFNLTHWESWHYHAKYIPIAPVWLWYCLKARSFWFFTASNPTITFGGFEGEGKREMYEQLPLNSYPRSIYIEPGLPFPAVEQLITSHQFTYPFAVKPDVGMMGFMFRKIHSAEELKSYHFYMKVEYIVQELIDFPLEVSVFYYRMPDTEKGTVSGFLMKQPPEVIGDGKSDLGTLLKKNKDLRYNLEKVAARHEKRLHMVLPEGEKFILSHASNRSQGGKLVSLAHEIDHQLLDLFDSISKHTRHFYYGRYDIKCTSVGALKNGKDFCILEYNGAGAGIQHIYGNNLSFWHACRTILHHWKMLYRISAHNHKNGVAYWKYNKGRKFLKAARQNLKILKKLDREFPTF